MTLAEAGFAEWAGAMSADIWRKVVGGVELLVTVPRGGGRVLARGGTFAADYPSVADAAAGLAGRFPGPNEAPGGVEGPALREVPWDEFQARRAGGDE